MGTVLDEQISLHFAGQCLTCRVGFQKPEEVVAAYIKHIPIYQAAYGAVYYLFQLCGKCAAEARNNEGWSDDPKTIKP